MSSFCVILSMQYWVLILIPVLVTVVTTAVIHSVLATEDSGLNLGPNYPILTVYGETGQQSQSLGLLAAGQVTIIHVY